MWLIFRSHAKYDVLISHTVMWIISRKNGTCQARHVTVFNELSRIILWILVLLIALKTAIDVKSHLREHKRARAFDFTVGPFSITVGNDKAAIKQEVAKIADKDALVAASKVKAYIKGKNMIISSDAIAAISNQVRAILDEAVARAKANRRRTVKPWDL